MQPTALTPSPVSAMFVPDESNCTPDVLALTDAPTAILDRHVADQLPDDHRPPDPAYLAAAPG